MSSDDITDLDRERSIDSVVELAERDQLRKEQEARSKKYGIGIKEDGHLTPPKGYPTDEDLYADPVNYAYPMDSPERARAAIAYWSRYKGKYTPSEQKIIEKRMKRLAEKYDIKTNFNRITINDIEFSIKEYDGERPVILSAPALKPGTWNGVFRFSSDSIRSSSGKWHGVEVLSDHDRTNPLATIGTVIDESVDDNGVLNLTFRLNNTTAGRDVAELIREGHKFSVSVGIEADTIYDEDDGVWDVSSIVPDHLALLRYGHQAVDDAHVSVISMSNEHEKEEMSMEEKEKLTQRIAELEAELETAYGQIAELKSKLEERDKEMWLGKIEELGMEYDKDRAKVLNLTGLKELYYELLERKVKELSKADEPVNVGDETSPEDNVFLKRE